MGIAGARILVVGASAGIGRDVGINAADAGAHVAFTARRVDALNEAVATAGGGIALALDVCDFSAVPERVEHAVATLGGLDAVVYAAGIARLGKLALQTADDWRAVLDTNVIGAAVVAQAVIPHLEARGGPMVFLSSTTERQPRWGLSAYGVSKAALNQLIDALRAEHREARFVRVTVGSTLGTEFGNHFDGEILTEAMAQWVVAAQHTANYLTSTDLADVLVRLLDVLLANRAIDVPNLSLEPPGGPLTLPATPDVLERLYSDLGAREH
ncbi:MAG: SDR family oxidoreductase [Acidimicrobiia bacterium]